MQTVDLEGNRHLIDAAKAAGVKQFIFVSVLGADPTSPTPFLQTKGQTEGALRESGIPYTIFAPNGYMELMVAGVVGIPVMMGQPVTIVGEVAASTPLSRLATSPRSYSQQSATRRPSIRSCCLAGRNPYRSGMLSQSTNVCLATRFKSEV